MKNLSALFIFMFFFFPLTIVFAQENNKPQKWYCYEEVVIPEMLNDYTLLAMELAELCKEKNFPFSYYSWTTGDYKYQLWTPINSLDEIEKIHEAWDDLLEDWDEEKLIRFRSCKVNNLSFTASTQPELSYEPEVKRLNDWEYKFMEWKEYYLVTDKVKEAETLLKEINEKLKSIQLEDGLYHGYGGLGYEDPCLISWTRAKDFEDNLVQSKKSAQAFSQDILELFAKFSTCIRTMKTKYMMYMEKLSYEKE